MTDYRLAARSVVAAHESGGLPAVEDWLKREFSVAATQAVAAHVAFLAATEAELVRLAGEVRALVPDLAAIDAGD